MSNDELTPEVEQEVTETHEEVEETKEEETPTEDSTDWKAEALKWKAIAGRKAKQAAKPEETKPEPITNNSLTREEVILLAKGMDEEAMNQLQAISKGKGISLLEAKEDPMFVAYNEQREKNLKAEQAKLGASKGSGAKKGKPDFSTPGLSKEDHKKLWQEKMGL